MTNCRIGLLQNGRGEPRPPFCNSPINVYPAHDLRKGKTATARALREAPLQEIFHIVYPDRLSTNHLPMLFPARLALRSKNR